MCHYGYRSLINVNQSGVHYDHCLVIEFQAGCIGGVNSIKFTNLKIIIYAISIPGFSEQFMGKQCHTVGNIQQD